MAGSGEKACAHKHYQRALRHGGDTSDRPRGGSLIARAPVDRRRDDIVDERGSDFRLGHFRYRSHECQQFQWLGGLDGGFGGEWP
jgi:hypothetical protein